MPIKVADLLPATGILEKENIFVMTEYRAMHQDIRPLDVLILNLVQASSAPQITDKCNAAGIPVVYINREPEAEREQAWVDEGIKATYVGADARQSGTFQGEEIAELENKGDADGDGVCDNCAGAGANCPGFADADGDGICDNYAQGNCYNGYHSGYCANGGYTDCPSYTDTDNNGACDNYANRGTGRGTGHNYGGGHHGGHHR